MTTAPGGEPTDDTGDPESGAATVLVCVRPGKDRELLTAALGDEYDVRVGETGDALDADVDLCVVDATFFEAHHAALERRKDAEQPAFLPVLLVASGTASGDSLARIWEVADDVMETPVGKAEFEARVANLLDRRSTATELVENRERLAQLVGELRVKERAMDAAPVGISISDPTQADNPLVYVNEGYERITGYDATDVVGRNCRLLQGPETGTEPVRRMREAIDDERPVSVDVLNYRKDGSKFWNRVDITPVARDGEVVNYVGFQFDITDRKIREQRLEVLNRVLTHNLRNDLNVVEGYAELLTTELDDEAAIEYASEITAATAKLRELSETVHRAERSLPDVERDPAPVDLRTVVASVRAAVRERFPAATVRTDVPEEPCPVACDGVAVAVTEATTHLLEYNDAEDPTVELALGTDRDRGRVVLTVADDGDGVPTYEREVIEDGMERPLKHNDGIDLWLVYWIVSSAGGGVSFEGDGAVSISLPRVDGVE